MPIDPSIPLQVQPIKIDSPTNQLAMMGEAMKLGEYQNMAEERNALRQRMSQGNFDINNAQHRQELYQLAPNSAPKVLGEMAITNKNLAQGAEANQKVDAARRIEAVQKVVSAPDANTAASIIQAGMADGSVPAAHGNDLLKQLSTMKYPDWQMNMIRSVVKPETVYAQGQENIRHATPSGSAKARLAQEESHFQQRLSQETATGVLTPETLDMAANVYLKTGQMPPLGMGKAATALRQSVLNRAAQIGGKGADGATVAPADIASNIVTAKQDVGSQTKAVKDFSTGIQGRQVNAFNTAIDHLSTMDKLSDALQNNDIKAFNSLGNVIAKQTGQPAPVNFDAAKQIVTAEIIKAVVASGGGVKERQEAENNFAAANSPAQLKGVINTYKQLLGGQLNSLGLQYENTTGRKDFDKKLTGDAKKEFSNVRQAHTGGAAPVAVKSDSDYNALPSGAIFIGPDGQQRRKP